MQAHFPCAQRSIRFRSCRGAEIAVLGDMLEIGKYTIEAHENNIGRRVADVADVIVSRSVLGQLSLQLTARESRNEKE